nr:family 43 glycosylhydrolase [Massilia cavernae]
MKPGKLMAAAGALLAALSAHPPATAGDTGFANPLVRQRADPHVTLHADGWYYFTATVPEYDRIELRRARTLDALGAAEAKTVWRKHASGAMGAHIWAPELHRIDGKWYLYFSAGRADRVWDIRLYVLENAADDPMEGQWVERGQLRTGWESFALDPTTFVHRGQRYLAWTQRAPGGGKATNIYLAGMDGPLTIRAPAVLLTRPEHPWEKIGHEVNEAPAVLVRNGRVLLTYSASATDASYALGLLSAPAGADLLDPASWTKSAAPVLRSSAATGQYGPGSPPARTARPTSWSTMPAITVTSPANRCATRTATRAPRRSAGVPTACRTSASR